MWALRAAVRGGAWLSRAVRGCRPPRAALPPPPPHPERALAALRGGLGCSDGREGGGRSPRADGRRSLADAEKDPEDAEEDEDEEELLRADPLLPAGTQRVCLVHPEVKWGRGKPQGTRAEWQVAEARALVCTLDGWSVVDTMVVPTKTPDKKLIFGRGTLEQLTERIGGSPEITAVFLNVERLATPTKKDLEAAWRVPVFDRFTVVLHIFRCNARSKEARLQVALAELPLLSLSNRHFFILCALQQQIFSIKGQTAKVWRFVGHVAPDKDYLALPLSSKRSIKIHWGCTKIKNKCRFLGVILICGFCPGNLFLLLVMVVSFFLGAQALPHSSWSGRFGSKETMDPGALQANVGPPSAWWSPGCSLEKGLSTLRGWPGDGSGKNGTWHLPDELPRADDGENQVPPSTGVANLGATTLRAGLGLREGMRLGSRPEMDGPWRNSVPQSKSGSKGPFRHLLPCGGKESAYNAGEGNGTPLQYSCLENPMDGGAC
ncbi:hypothetical protein FD755_016357 [Muntiacus reevesi]|uniref:GTPase HflX N-terminal domain-containing protein n=1 Tax=Muntiacus reevesi TaxID=9886 RepID=A0A5N3XJC3_MUNRE|nr:hypothetical protein FD755_016357 [Muntiacus reevesi]